MKTVFLLGVAGEGDRLTKIYWTKWTFVYHSTKEFGNCGARLARAQQYINLGLNLYRICFSHLFSDFQFALPH